MDNVSAEARKLSPENRRFFTDAVQSMRDAEMFGTAGQVDAERENAITAARGHMKVQNLLRMTHILSRDELLALNERLQAEPSQVAGAQRLGRG